jgi:hypothetical protein
LFDGIGLNSIPVIFEQTTLDVQYPYFFPNPRDYSILLNSTDDLMGQLRAIPEERIKQMQSNIATIRESLLYSDKTDAFDASWVLMKELKRYKQNGFVFDDPFANRTFLECLKRKTTDGCRFG